MPELLKPETNIAYEIALKFSDGKPCDGRYGPQFYFTLEDGRGLYLDPPVSEKIQRLGIRAGQPFEICKREVKNGAKKSIEWEVKPVGETASLAPRAGIAAPPTVAASSASNTAAAIQQQSNGTVTNPNAVIGLRAVSNLESAGLEAVGVIARVEAEAKAKLGERFEFTSEDVRAIWLSLFIGVDRAVGVSQWRH